MSEYLQKITDCLSAIEFDESPSIARASRLVANAIKGGGLIFTFGCGHSHLPGLDAHYRAGGLANVSPILDTDLMLHNGAAKSSRMEKMSGLAPEILRRYSPTNKDVLFVFSSSGKNRVPIEMLMEAKKYGVPTVSVSSFAYKDKGGELHLFSDVAIDNHVPYGDACVAVADKTMGGLSTYAACFILNTCLMRGAQLASDEGASLPVYLSGNIEGGKEHNLALENAYMGRVKHL